jgi:hypothetical protein
MDDPRMRRVRVVLVYPHYYGWVVAIVIAVFNFARLVEMWRIIASPASHSAPTKRGRKR